MQVCIFIFQYPVTIWLESVGINRDMGHSLGEIPAAGELYHISFFMQSFITFIYSAIACTFTLETGLQFVVEKAKLLRADLVPQDDGVDV